jgi:signal transduction histidine kinase/CheY-like chemotaxis protein
MSILEQALERTGHWVGEIKHWTKDGHEVIVESRQQIVTRADGSRLVLETNRDITDRKRLEHELNLRLEELKAADRHKNEFLATLAHELRNPLAPVVNIVELLRMKELPAKEAEWARDVLQHQVNQIGRLLDDLLDVGRITGGTLELRKEWLELNKVIEEAVETSRPHIDAKEHRLSVQLPSESIMINADSARLEQVFSNLLNNAAKYTPRGGQIEIGAAVVEDHQAVIRVKDNGMGIPASLLPVIFDLFVQERHSLGAEPAGLGLGLTIVRKLVELHEGSIEAHSAGRDLGSEFIVRLPVANAPAVEDATAPAPAATSSAMPRRRILVVDDREEQTRSLRMLLERMGHEVHVATDGPSALQALSKHPCDVALIDIGLEGMDGHDLARRIRQQPQFRDLVLVAQTGWGRESDRQRSRDSGFDHHLVKPINRDALEQILQDLERKP